MARTVFDLLFNNRLSRPMRRSLERRALAFRAVRRRWNRAYNRVSYEKRFSFYAREAKLFRGHSADFGCDVWEVDVPPFHLKMPLRSSHAWLDWDLALSVLGHECEIKTLYAALLSDKQLRPDLFCDVGANYGVHTALFSAAGVRSVSFEPNQLCSEYFFLLRQLNDLKNTRWETAALSDASGSVALAFPENETWLGTVDTESTMALAAKGEVTTVTVPMLRLDDLSFDAERCLTKVDAEGSDLRVIRGGRRFLREQCEFLVFESNEPLARPQQFDELAAMEFSIEYLPVQHIQRPAPLDRNDFLVARGANFLARNLRLSR